jgi:hypothetical protein
VCLRGSRGALRPVFDVRRCPRLLPPFVCPLGVCAVLPFLQRQTLFLAPIGALAAAYALSLLLQLNVARWALGVYIA